MMKNTISKFIGITIAIILIFQNLQVFAVTEQELQKQKIDAQNKANEQKEENNEKINQAKEKMEEIESEKSETMKTVESLMNKISDSEDEIEELENKIQSLQEQISNKEKDIQQKQEEYTKQEELLDKRLVAMYERSETSYLDVFLNSSSMTDALAKYYAATELFEADKELMKTTKEKKEQIENEKTELENNKAELDSSLAKQNTKVNELQSLKNEKQNYVKKLTNEEKEIQNEIEELEKDNKQLEKEIKAATDKYKAQIEALKKQQSNSGASTSSGSGYFIRPVSGGTISANGYYPSSLRFHGAIDYAVPTGSVVKAAADGVVLTVKDLTTSYGTHVVIQHANGTQTWYGHGTRGSICVKPGQIVKQGEKIMLSGSTGHSSGPHLHFEVRVYPYNYKTGATAYGQDSRVDPNKYM